MRTKKKNKATHTEEHENNNNKTKATDTEEHENKNNNQSNRHWRTLVNILVLKNATFHVKQSRLLYGVNKSKLMRDYLNFGVKQSKFCFEIL